jgi:hypothetical protein
VTQELPPVVTLPAHKRLPVVVNATLPVAASTPASPVGNPDTESVTVFGWAAEAGPALAVIDVAAWEIVKLVVVDDPR